MHYVDQAIGRFRKRLASIIAVKWGEALNTWTQCLTWPPFTARITASRFRNCPIAWSTYVRRVCSSSASPCRSYRSELFNDTVLRFSESENLTSAKVHHTIHGPNKTRLNVAQCQCHNKPWVSDYSFVVLRLKSGIISRQMYERWSQLSPSKLLWKHFCFVDSYSCLHSYIRLRRQSAIY